MDHPGIKHDLTVLAVKRRRGVTSCIRVNLFHRDPDAQIIIYFAENPLTRTSAPSPATHNRNNDTPTTTPTATHNQPSSTRTAYCTQPIPCNSRGDVGATSVDVMSTQASATEPGDANINNGDCQITNDGAGDCGVVESKGDESASSHRLFSKPRLPSSFFCTDFFLWVVEFSFLCGSFFFFHCPFVSVHGFRCCVPVGKEARIAVWTSLSKRGRVRTMWKIYLAAGAPPSCATHCLASCLLFD